MLPQREAFYGGAAGGGKSDSLLMAALQYVKVKNYSAILFRKTFGDLSLPGALLDRAHDWLSETDAVWKDQKKYYLFPRTNAKLAFGYLDSERDKYRYQSAEFQFIGFDELTQFTLSQFRYLFSRLRRLEGFDVPLRIRGASNPGGIGHEWAKARYVDPGHADRPFIPARLEDNPYLDQEEYIESLMNLDGVTRAQLLSGDWEARHEGSMFDRAWFDVVDDFPVDCKLCRFWDMAATKPKAGSDPDYTTGTLVGLSDGIYYIIDIKRIRDTPRRVESLVLQTAMLDGRAVPIRMEKEGGSSGVNMIDYYARKVLVGFDFLGAPPRTSKIIRARPWSSAAEAGNVKIVKGVWNEKFIDEIELFPDGPHDDQVDTVSGATDYLGLQYVRPMVYGDTSPEVHPAVESVQAEIYALLEEIEDPDEKEEALRMIMKEGL